MAWFKRSKKNIATTTKEKRETPEGLWYKCPDCGTVHAMEDHKNNLWVCDNCGYHSRVNANEYFEILFDNNKFTELDPYMISGDPLEFEDTKQYTDRLAASRKKTGLKDAIQTAYGKLNKQEVVVACMNFNFIGGSMGSVVGEKIARAIDYALENEVPFIMISKSGGARMMEAAFSLMQMAKTSAKLSLLDKKGIPYISFLTDPTTGGVNALWVQAKYGNAKYAPAFQPTEYKVSMSRAAKVVRLQIIQTVSGFKASLQNISIWAKQGKIR